MANQPFDWVLFISGIPQSNRRIIRIGEKLIIIQKCHLVRSVGMTENSIDHCAIFRIEIIHVTWLGCSNNITVIWSKSNAKNCKIFDGELILDSNFENSLIDFNGESAQNKTKPDHYDSYSIPFHRFFSKLCVAISSHFFQNHIFYFDFSLNFKIIHLAIFFKYQSRIKVPKSYRKSQFQNL